VGIDATPHLLEEAARRSVQSGLDVEWREGDMEALSVDDASFDRVLSSFGAIFAVDQHRTATELVRVCRPGGRIGLTAWALDGLFDRMSSILVSRLPAPPPATPAPRDWASSTELERIFAGLPVDMALEQRSVSAPFASPEAAVEFFESRAAPTMAAREALAGAGRWEDARGAVVQLFSEAATAEGEGDSCRLALDYVVAVFDVSG